jgi:hypothetical protein
MRKKEKYVYGIKPEASNCFCLGGLLLPDTLNIPIDFPHTGKISSKTNRERERSKTHKRTDKER